MVLLKELVIEVMAKKIMFRIFVIAEKLNLLFVVMVPDFVVRIN
jgi:hypothetical protein